MLNRGTKDAEWQKVRRAWIRQNPPNHQGHYVCGICGRTVHISDMELDHINPRSGSPESFADFSNLQPSHGWPCNRLKGSRRMKPVIPASEYELRRILDL